MSSPKHSIDVEMLESRDEQGVLSLTPDELAMEKRMVRKIDMIFLPVTALTYLLCYLDRSNIGSEPHFTSCILCDIPFSAYLICFDTGDDLMHSLHLSKYEYTIALMLFLVAYCVFETPSNLALKILTPNRWLGFLIFVFGSICAGIGGIHDFAGIGAMRFFLGAAEAGVFPGMIYYFSFWYKPEERALRIATFLSSASLAGAFGGCIAYGVGHMNMVGGLEAWRWLFIIEGIPSVILGVLVFFFLPSYPENCNFLNTDEKRLQARRLGELASRLYAHYLAYTGIGCLISSLSLFAPTIVEGLGFVGLRAQLFTVPPYALAFICSILTAFVSDHFRVRGPVTFAALSTCCISFVILAALPGEHFTARYVLLVISTCGAFAGLPSMNAWIGDNVSNTTAMSIAVGLNVAFSGPGQIIGVWIYRAQDKPFYRLGHGINGGFSAMSACIALALCYYYHRKNVKGDKVNGRSWII
ncbi:major facilitator superfamily transporter [Fusarium globosum]|uniref:Major facilitator superfamily transporter n=1 Tax=Fusarium globosum TaxID=78864 RepID=A0A8H6DMZ1_9HYPO|nr:major facilitator superfamily transporter [Fusarium globosum]